MPKFKKKPLVIEAVQFTGDNVDELQRFCGFHKDSSGQHEMNTFNKLGTYLLDYMHPDALGELWVAANRQWLPIVKGEWVIKDSLGFYPCRDGKFQETYDPVADLSPYCVRCNASDHAQFNHLFHETSEHEVWLARAKGVE